MKKFAFTLTELMIALGIIGILCAVLLPIIFNLMPNQNTIMAKRAYYAIQEAVSDLINDESCYPDNTLNDINPRVGFDDGNGYSSCQGWTSGSSANSKFIALFKSRLDTGTGSDNEFTTKDNMSWVITFDSEDKNTFDDTKNDPTYYATIIVDVNSANSDPNCGQSTISGECSDGRTKGFDKFSVKVYADGNTEIIDDWAQNAVQINKDVTEE